MRSRDVVGRQIVAVHQCRRHDGRLGMYTHVNAIELEGGIFLIPDTREQENLDYGQEVQVLRPEDPERFRKWIKGRRE